MKVLGLGRYELDTAFGTGGLQSTTGKKGLPLCLLHVSSNTNSALEPLAPALQWISKQEGNAAIIVVASSISSTNLQTYFSSSTLSGLSPTQVVHFVPMTAIAKRDVHDVARSLYDRFLRQLRRVDHVNEGEPPWYQYPSFTLSPDDPPKPKLTLQWPIKSYDVFGSWRWIHVAYSWSVDGQSIIVMISDAEGENWQVKVLPLDRGAKAQIKVKAIWDLANAFATAAAIEYRISVCHLGIMSPDEIECKSFWLQPETRLTT